MKKILLYLLCLAYTSTVLSQDTTNLRLYKNELEFIKRSYKRIDTNYIKCQYSNKGYIPNACLDCLPAWEISIDTCIQKLYGLILKQSLLTQKGKTDITKMRTQWNKSKKTFTTGMSSFYYRLDQKYARADIRDVHSIYRQRIYKNHFDALYEMLEQSIYYEMEHIAIDKK